MFEIFKFGSKEKQEPVQEKDINQLRAELTKKIAERDEILGMRTSSFGSPEDVTRDAKSKELDKEVSNLRKEIAEKESTYQKAA